MSDTIIEFLEHHGVKGMKWGVINRYNENRNRELLPNMTVTTDKGVNVTLKEDPTPRAQAALAAISPKFHNFISGAKGFTISVGDKEVGEAAFKEKSKDELNLAWITVNEEYRGQGYATTVFDSAVAYAKKQGYKKLTLEVPGKAHDARHIYEKFGFKNDGELDGDENDIWGGLQPMSYTINGGA